MKFDGIKCDSCKKNNTTLETIFHKYLDFKREDGGFIIEVNSVIVGGEEIDLCHDCLKSYLRNFFKAEKK